MHTSTYLAAAGDASIDWEKCSWWSIKQIRRAGSLAVGPLPPSRLREDRPEMHTYIHAWCMYSSCFMHWITRAITSIRIQYISITTNVNGQTANFWNNEYTCMHEYSMNPFEAQHKRITHSFMEGTTYHACSRCNDRWNQWTWIEPQLKGRVTCR